MPVYDYSSSTNPARPYADMGIIREIASNEQAWYRAGTIELHKLAINNSNLTWDLSYTHASSYDEETNTRSTSTTFLIDPNNPRLSEAYSDNDIRHRVVGGVHWRTWRTPMGPATLRLSVDAGAGCVEGTFGKFFLICVELGAPGGRA